MKHILTAEQFTRGMLDELFAAANTLREKPDNSLSGKIMASLFYEPSTRTRFSFESAAFRLGAGVLSAENAREFSSAAKGETLEDTLQVMRHYADVVVMRHHEQGAIARAAQVGTVPVINAGDGAGQHPTQALLDIYTMQRELGVVDGLHIALVGDLSHGRTVRSLLLLLTLFAGVRVTLVSPPGLAMDSSVIAYARERGVEVQETEVLDAVLPVVDVLYVTRLQKERFTDPAVYEQYRGLYVVDVQQVQHMKQASIIMHPLPRVDEITPAVDALPQAAYFRQAENGLFVRMALLRHVLAG